MSLMSYSVLTCLDFLDAGKKNRIKDSKNDALMFQGPQGCCDAQDLVALRGGGVVKQRAIKEFFREQTVPAV